MEKNCIQDAKLEETGFSYTMSLIQGKYKMFNLYALMDFGVVALQRAQEVHTHLSYKTLSATLKELEPTAWSTARSIRRSLRRLSTASPTAACSLIPILDQMCTWGDENRM